MLKAPSFWQKPHDWRGRLLAPLGAFYGWVSTFYQFIQRNRKGVWVPPLPVICVGNFTLGGAGKTPVTLSFGKLLQEKGLNVHFVTRGYGGSLSEKEQTLLVRKDLHTAEEVGDEPLLLANLGPTWVGTDRRKGLESAWKEGAQVALLDDGLQETTLQKTFSVAVVDGILGLGNGAVFPAGPLRESWENGKEKIQGLVVLGQPEIWCDSTHFLVKEASKEGIPLLNGWVIPQEMDSSLKTKPLFAFAGLAYPEKFFQLLEKQGCLLKKTLHFPDHYLYKKEDKMALQSKAEKEGLHLITTEKDWVRFSPEERKGIHVFKICVAWASQEKIWACLEKYLSGSLPSQG